MAVVAKRKRPDGRPRAKTSQSGLANKPAAQQRPRQEALTRGIRRQARGSDVRHGCNQGQRSRQARGAAAASGWRRPRPRRRSRRRRRPWRRRRAGRRAPPTQAELNGIPSPHGGAHDHYDAYHSQIQTLYAAARRSCSRSSVGSPPRYFAQEGNGRRRNNRPARAGGCRRGLLHRRKAGDAARRSIDAGSEGPRAFAHSSGDPSRTRPHASAFSSASRRQPTQIKQGDTRATLVSARTTSRS